MAKLGKDAIVMSRPSDGPDGVIRVAVRPNGSVIRQRFLSGKSDGWVKIQDASQDIAGRIDRFRKLGFQVEKCS